MSSIKGILPQFPFIGKFVSATELTSGNINNTYHLTYKSGERIIHYTLQHINPYVFKEPEKVMENIKNVTEHLKSTLEEQGLDPTRRVLQMIRTKKGEIMYKDAEGYYWRAYYYIDNATPYNSVKKPEHFYEVGRIFT